jgi:hypothetical protein
VHLGERLFSFQNGDFLQLCAAPFWLASRGFLRAN